MKNFDSSQMAEYAFTFWFNDNEHIRSPFPDYIQNELRIKTTQLFEDWLEGLHIDASEEVDEEMMAEKFEQLLFESAIPLIKTEDERISILYPFLPRIGDLLTDDVQIESSIVDRHLFKDGDSSFLKVICQRKSDNSKWETSFELTI